MKKRLHTPKAKPGQLVVAWGRVDRHNKPSIVYAYPDRDGKCDSRIICDALEGERYRPSYSYDGPGYEVDRSLLEELAARGYDLTTLRLTISKRADTSEVPGEKNG
ncbi:hypothetical protein G6L37_00100 [Agrobacterium rubi]|nr:hypothetical protein [Agrobacterium rubi]NTF23651.1 hypothetical protein [Agrobacterium rubi]